MSQNQFVDAFIMYRYDLRDVNPTIRTEYDWSNKERAFEPTLEAINACQLFTNVQKDHFTKCIDFLKNCNYPLDKYRTINIAESNARKTMNHVEMVNAKYILTGEDDEEKIGIRRHDRKRNANAAFLLTESPISCQRIRSCLSNR